MVTTPPPPHPWRKKEPSESSEELSQVLANAKSNDPPENNDLPKVVTSKVISLFARNNGSYRYNKLCETDQRFIFNG